MNLKVTSVALSELQRVKTEQKLPDDVFVRVSIKAGGCSGFTYGLNFEEASQFNEQEDGVELEQDGLRVVVNKKQALFLEGTTLDFYTDLARRGFSFDNPNAKRTCGCGNSFGT